MRRNFVISCLSSSLLLAFGGLAHAGKTVDVAGMTVVDSDAGTRALIDVPAGTRYQVFALANPNRLVVDLRNSRLGADFKVPGPDGVVANVRTGEPTPGDVRLVLDLAAKVHPKTWFQDQDGQSRLVIELQSTGFAHRAPALKPATAVLPIQKEPLSIQPVADASGAGHGGTSANVAVALPLVEPPTAAPLEPAVVGGSVIVPAALGADDAARPTSTSSRGEPPRHAVATDSRRDNPRVDPPASPVAVSPPSAQDDVATAAAPSDPLPVYRPGARTMRDVLGAGQRKIVIAVDAGHGGQDVGAKGYTGSYEKNVTLATARELARQINAEPGMKAVLTRDGDYFVPLAERYHKAREARADLFISIHADADPTHSATGSSVWVLSQRGVTSQAAKWLADRENAADLIGGVSLSDKDNTLASVLLDLSQSATMKASEDAAERVHQALRDIGRTHKAHPERANFVVLRSPDVPSMLVETAFITNSEEEQHLNDSAYRARLAAAVLGGVRGYFIDNPLPGTEYAALHERGSRNVRLASAAPPPRMIATAMRQDDDARDAVERAPQRHPPVELATADDLQQYHVVQRGERLIDIANQYGVSVMRLREANDLQGNQVRPGQQLRIPARSGAG